MHTQNDKLADKICSPKRDIDGDDQILGEENQDRKVFHPIMKYSQSHISVGKIY